MTVDPPCNTTMAHCKVLCPFKNEAIAPVLHYNCGPGTEMPTPMLKPLRRPSTQEWLLQ